LDGVAFNAELIPVKDEAVIPKLPVMVSENARIASIKASVDGKGLIYRICEYNGKYANATLVIPKSMKVKNAYETDMKEEERELLKINKSNIDFELRPFEIKTIYIEI